MTSRRQPHGQNEQRGFLQQRQNKASALQWLFLRMFFKFKLRGSLGVLSQLAHSVPHTLSDIIAFLAAILIIVSHTLECVDQTLAAFLQGESTQLRPWPAATFINALMAQDVFLYCNSGSRKITQLKPFFVTTLSKGFKQLLQKQVSFFVLRRIKINKETIFQVQLGVVWQVLHKYERFYLKIDK